MHAMSGYFEGTIVDHQETDVLKSVHFLVGQKGQVAQMVLTSHVAWHAGNRKVNRESIGIELEDGGRERFLLNPAWVTPELYDSAVELVACLAQQFKIQIDAKHILRHSDVPDSNKSDPGQYWDMAKFIESVKQAPIQCPTEAAR